MHKLNLRVYLSVYQVLHLKLYPSPQAAPLPQAVPIPQAAPSPQPTPQAAPSPQPTPQAAPSPQPTPQAAPSPQSAPQAAATVTVEDDVGFSPEQIEAQLLQELNNAQEAVDEIRSSHEVPTPKKEED